MTTTGKIRQTKNRWAGGRKDKLQGDSQVSAFVTMYIIHNVTQALIIQAKWLNSFALNKIKGRRIVRNIFRQLTPQIVRIRTNHSFLMTLCESHYRHFNEMTLHRQPQFVNTNFRNRLFHTLPIRRIVINSSSLLSYKFRSIRGNMVIIDLAVDLFL